MKFELDVEAYDESIVPLLRQMLNLDSLSLECVIRECHRFMDGYDLQKDIIDHLSRLKVFAFNIRSVLFLTNQVSLLSNEDIRRTFANFPIKQIISCVDYFPKNGSGQCHMYSYPYPMHSYDNITNNFPGGLFQSVRRISLFDERPFEHAFFVRIAQAFPFVTILSFDNRKGQNLKNNNIHYPLIRFPHLMELDLLDAHKHYVELFLDHTKTLLSNHVSLTVEYSRIRKLTDNFKNDRLRINCAKMTELSIPANIKHSQRLNAYFPRLQRSHFYNDE